MITKYGKSVVDIQEHKQHFFDDNENLVKEQAQCAEQYNRQPIRTECKMCKEPFATGISFHSHGVDYVICKKCGHICGTHEETKAYCDYLYLDSNYSSYMYMDNIENKEKSKKKYDKRTADIYLPKAKFLKEVLETEGLLENQIKIFDIGAGSGYFVSACDDLNLQSHGVDMSQTQIYFGNQFLHKENTDSDLRTIEAGELEHYVRVSDCNVISAIGVVEHLIDFHEVFEAACSNRNIKYFYMMVPMFGLSNILEMMHPDVYNRHLGGVHTHVFSHQSIDYLCEKYGMEIIAKWQFGTDMMDMFRICMVKNGLQMEEVLREKLYPCLDQMQLVLDQHDFCSEIHVVLKLKSR